MAPLLEVVGLRKTYRLPRARLFGPRAERLAVDGDVYPLMRLVRCYFDGSHSLQ